MGCNFGSKIQPIDISIVPSANSSSGLDPISTSNNIYALSNKIDYQSGINLFMDNQQIGNLIARSNNQSSTDQIISFEQINDFIAKQASKLTAARRFGGSKFTNFAEIIANSVPYP